MQILAKLRTGRINAISIGCQMLGHAIFIRDRKVLGYAIVIFNREMLDYATSPRERVAGGMKIFVKMRTGKTNAFSIFDRKMQSAIFIVDRKMQGHHIVFFDHEMLGYAIVLLNRVMPGYATSIIENTWPAGCRSSCRSS